MAYLEGRLSGVDFAAGGEHTGFELTLEVDMSKIGDEARDLIGRTAAISGEVFLKNYTERGPVLVFEATRATEKLTRH